MNTLRILGILAAVAAVALTAQPARADGEPSGEGAKLFDTKCASCHGKDGSGTTAMGKKLKLRDLRSDEVQKRPDPELYKTTSKGKGKMPAYDKKLTEAQINALIAHVRLLAKKK